MPIHIFLSFHPLTVSFDCWYRDSHGYVAYSCSYKWKVFGVCLSLHMDKLSQDVNWHKTCLLGAHVSHLVSSCTTIWWLTEGLIGWLAAWLVDWQRNWLTDWLYPPDSDFFSLWIALSAFNTTGPWTLVLVVDVLFWGGVEGTEKEGRLGAFQGSSIR